MLRPGSGCSCRASELRLCLLQPEPHAHLAVHRRGGSEARLGLRAIAGAPVELPEAEVAVGHERAHLEGLGEGQRLVVALASRCGRAAFASRGDLGLDAQRPGLEPPLAALA